jgi:NADPH:quinone reductase-like Zn-dependent oxidoreductase
VPCSDGAGKVVAVGQNVNRFAVGDPVAPLFFPRWLHGAALGDERSVSSGLEAPGVLREYGVYAEDQVARVAPHLSAVEAACYPCAGLTAWTSLVDFSHIAANDWVLVQGTGGVSIAALQFAKALGASVIATSSSEEKLARASALGADHTINYRTHPDWGQIAFDLTGSRGVDAVIEIGGTGTLSQSLAAIRRGGHINIIGYLAGIGVDLTVYDLIMKNANLHGVSVGNRDSFDAMMTCIADHGIRPAIGQRHDFSDAPRAITGIAEGAHFGKIVIDY